MAHTEPGPERNGTGAPPGTTTSFDDASPSAVRVPPTDGARREALGDATLLELVGRFLSDLSDLVDRQVELARQEVREDLGEAKGAAISLGLGAALGAAVGLLLLIWAYTGLIWFFNFVGGLLTLGPVNFGWIGWLIGLLVPAGFGWFAYKRFIQPGLRIRHLRPLRRTRQTLREDLEWLKTLRTPSAR